MTAIIGLKCNEGIVLCADSQESVQAVYLKGHRGKIITHIYENSVVAFAGSGPNDYVDTAIETAAEGIADDANFLEVRDHIQANLLKFFDVHLSRWQGYLQSERPEIELLVGISARSGGTDLFYYEGTSFHRTSQRAIGTGIVLAKHLITDLCPDPNRTIEELAGLAVYILRRLKERVEYCGGFTDLVALKSGGTFAFTDSSEIESLEDQFRKIDAHQTQVLRKSILSEKRLQLKWMDWAKGRA